MSHAAEAHAEEQIVKAGPRRRVEYKLHYFNLKGRGELARLVLAYAKVPYDDVRYTPEEWAKKKDDMPFGQVPVLEWRSQLLPQSRAIVRFLAHRHGLAGKDEWHAARIDAYLELIFETVEDIRPVFTAGEDQEKRKQALDHFMEHSMEPLSKRLEKQLADNDSGYLIGHHISVADLGVLYIYDFVSSMTGSDCVPKTKCLAALYQRVRELPAIKAWLEKRPATPY